jgi:alpha-galactosidase
MDGATAKYITITSGMFPCPADWERAQPIAFCSDWQGMHEDPQRKTEARLLWSQMHLFIRFHCRYRDIYVYEGGPIRRDQLWLRDTAELFIQPGDEDPGHYREFEISPNGDWLDLDISPGKKTHLFWNLKSRVTIDADRRLWTAELAIPLDGLSPAFDPGEIWKLNLFRIEGAEPHRFYSAWRPTHTPQPNFHVPAQFGALQFEK